MNTLTLGVSDFIVHKISLQMTHHSLFQLLLSAVVAAVLSSPTHGGGKNGSGDKCRPTTVCSQVRDRGF